MAVIDLQSLPHNRKLWETLTASDTGEPLYLKQGGAQVAVQALGTFGGTVSLQGTIDGSTWFDLTSGPGGEAISFTAAGYAEITTAVWALRPSAGSGVSDVDVYIRIIA